MSNLMKGKKGVIMGLANKMSIAYGIAKSLVENGAEVVLTYQGEVLLKRIQPIAEELGIKIIIECDVSTDETIERTFKEIHKEVGNIDFIVHSIAYSDKNQLRGNVYDTTRENFNLTMDISCYSFIAICRYAQPYLNENASLLTLTYYGAEKYIPHYNIMGVAKAALEASVRYLSVDFGKEKKIRVNAISAGPIKTLAASGIGDFKLIFSWMEENTPLKRNTTIDEVGGTATYLLSSLASGVTGEVLHVDSGYHTIGMKMVD
ncbi:MAG: enoyl-[acyl-carrier protein] reductase I [Candidatus Deianiraeaceae bacterium]|jgi:enoyl-[acyl-carrier protein] reductase I